MEENVENDCGSCHESARQVERAVQILGRQWSGYIPITDLCSRYRQRCDEMVAGRDLGMNTIAFVGPKKAGKSSLIRLLLRDEAVRNRITAGSSLKTTTDKLIWIGPKQPVGMGHAVEAYLPCPESYMSDLGMPYTLADVPGDNESHSAIEQAAHRAFDLSLVKVLVVDFTDRQNRDVFEMFKRAGRTLIIPVITKIRPTDDRGELSGYRDRVAGIAPEAIVLEPLLCDDFDHVDTPGDYRERFAHVLAERLASGLIGHQRPRLLAEYLEGERVRFVTEARLLAEHHLRASTYAVVHFQRTLRISLEAATKDLLGNQKELYAGIRWSLRMAMIERSPAWCFPWRPFLTVAGLAGGAVDRLPFALVGSLPSLGTVIYRTVRNVKEVAAFQVSAAEGLKKRLSQNLRGALHGQFQLLDNALRCDLGEDADVATGERATLEPIGLDKLQDMSTEMFGRIIESHAPSRFAAIMSAFLGFAIFWGVFGWPLAALYQNIARGARAVVESRLDAAALFPQRTGSILITSGFLAIVPMFLFLLAAMSWLIRQSTVRRCLAELRRDHNCLCTDLIENGGVSVRITEPRLDACRSLLTKHQ